MISELETGDIFRAAYLISRGGTLARAIVEGGDHVVFALRGENLAHEDKLYRTSSGLVEPLRLKENLNRLRDLVKSTLRQVDTRPEHHDRRIPHATYPAS